ncbi:hypothetical protein Leryth_009844 [Lithospermum erythrorhizon]|nr:hypothetical protein Leryth_009844 [Lithospermum erythrorhizon]
MRIMMAGWLLMKVKSKNRSDEEEDLPSMEALQISKKNTVQSISSYFGGGKRYDIPDMVHVNVLINCEVPLLLYDKYYQTSGGSLDMMSQDHARKTVTIEDHPHLPGKHASVHPCRHGAVMKKIIDVLMSRGVEPEVDKYIFLFLKFMASVIPTIEYDYTMDFDLGSSSS